MDDIDGAFERDGHRRKVTAVQHVIDPNGVNGTLHCGRVERNGVEIELRDVTGGRSSHHVRFPWTKTCVLSKLVAETVTPGQHRQRSPNVGANQLELGKTFQAAGKNKSSQGERGVKGSAQHLRKPE